MTRSDFTLKLSQPDILSTIPRERLNEKVVCCHSCVPVHHGCLCPDNECRQLRGQSRRQRQETIVWRSQDCICQKIRTRQSCRQNRKKTGKKQDIAIDEEPGAILPLLLSDVLRPMTAFTPRRSFPDFHLFFYQSCLMLSGIVLKVI